MDRHMITDPRVMAFLRETAEANQIPYQLKTSGGGGTDGGAIHTSHTGRSHYEHVRALPLCAYADGAAESG